MKERYYYFNFHIEVPDTGFIANDWTVVSSDTGKFPICAVRRWAMDEFGEDVTILVTNVIEVTLEDFKQLVSDVDRETAKFEESHKNAEI